MRKAVLGAVPFLCAALWAFGLIGHHPYNGALIGNLGWSVVGVIGDGAAFRLMGELAPSPSPLPGLVREVLGWDVRVPGRANGPSRF